jgi:hypothetical protein
LRHWSPRIRWTSVRRLTFPFTGIHFWELTWLSSPLSLFLSVSLSDNLFWFLVDDDSLFSHSLNLSCFIGADSSLSCLSLSSWEPILSPSDWQFFSSRQSYIP